MNAQTRRRRWWLAAGAVVVIATGAAGCAEPGGSASTPIVGSSATTATAGSSPIPTGPSGSGTCSAIDLELTGQQSNGGMGTAGTEFTVRNHSSHACQLRGVPTLQAVTTSGGAPGPVPVQSNGSGLLVTLTPGGSATLAVTYPNGYAGYGPNDTHCQHPVSYSQFAIVLTDGSTLDLGDFNLDILCGGPIGESPWSAA